MRRAERVAAVLDQHEVVLARTAPRRPGASNGLPRQWASEDRRGCAARSRRRSPRATGCRCRARRRRRPARARAGRAARPWWGSRRRGVITSSPGRSGRSCRCEHAAATASRLACEPEPTSATCRRARDLGQAGAERGGEAALGQPAVERGVDERAQLGRADDLPGHGHASVSRARTGGSASNAARRVALRGGERLGAQGVEVVGRAASAHSLRPVRARVTPVARPPRARGSSSPASRCSRTSSPTTRG